MAEADESEFLRAIDREVELFVAISNFDAALKIARRHDRRLFGIEAVRITGERLSFEESLGVVTVDGDDTCWEAARVQAALWPQDPGLAIGASFETDQDVRDRS